MDLLSALALISAEKSIRKQEKRNQFWEDVFSRQQYNANNKAEFKFSKGTIKVVTVLLVLLGLTMLCAYVSSR